MDSSESIDGEGLERMMRRFCIEQERHVFAFLFALHVPPGMEREFCRLSPSNAAASYGIQTWRLSREVWCQGLLRLGCCAAADIPSTIRAIGEAYDQKDVKDMSVKACHRFLFMFINKASTSVSCVARDDAVETLALMLQGKWELLDEFVAYLKSAEVKAYLLRDEWFAVIEFAGLFSTAKSLQRYDACTAHWPVLLDGFVDWLKTRVTPS